MDEDSSRVGAFKRFDFDTSKNDIEAILTTSRDWWPADYGHYGPFIIRTAWAAASTFVGTDLRAGANGAGIRLASQKDGDVNALEERAKVLSRLEPIRANINSAQSGDKKVSLAEVVVLGGAAAIEQAANEAGYDVLVPFTPGCTDASQAQTDVNSFAVREPIADGFRNYFGSGNRRSPAEIRVDQADFLNLTAPEMTVLVGAAAPTSNGIYEGRNRSTGEFRWTATPVDRVFGSHSEPRPVAEVYAADNAQDKFVRDFAKAWTRVMTLD